MKLHKYLEVGCLALAVLAAGIFEPGPSTVAPTRQAYAQESKGKQSPPRKGRGLDARSSVRRS